MEIRQPAALVTSTVASRSASRAVVVTLMDTNRLTSSDMTPSYQTV